MDRHQPLLDPGARREPHTRIRGLLETVRASRSIGRGAAGDAARTLADGNPLVFPNRWGNPVKDTFLSELLRKLNIAAVPHGFRSRFRDWAEEKTDHPREVVEAALAHVVRNRVEAVYARSDLFERRRRLMDEWAAYLAATPGECWPGPSGDQDACDDRYTSS